MNYQKINGLKKLIIPVVLTSGFILFVYLSLFRYPINVFAQIGPGPYPGNTDCGVSSDCPNDPSGCRRLSCTNTCSSGTICTCVDQCSNPIATGGSCSGGNTSTCAGPAPCPIGLSGNWSCVSGSCQSFCGGSPGGTGGTSGAGVPTPTPTPPVPPNCNNWTCGTCSGSPATYSCVNNCGFWFHYACYGTVNSRAVVVRSNASCTDVQNSTVGVPGTVHQFTAGSASQPAPKTQVGAGYVTFSGIWGGIYTEAPVVPANYNLALACWKTQLNAPLSGTGLTNNLSVPKNLDTLTWDLGYTAGSPWVQTQGGNVYGAGNLTSFIPSGIVPRVFNASGDGGYPGIVTYGAAYDFDASPTSQGANLVSSTNWLTNQTHPAVDYYAYFANKFDVPGTATAYAGGVQPAGSGIYYVNGDLTTSGNWNVPAGQTIVMFVIGNLTLGGKVNITGNGFIAFIVKGNITVLSSVGGLYTSSLPSIEGVYVTSPTGVFYTGTSTVAGAERLVGKGMFIAGNFSLQRDLDAITQNQTTPAELFTYNPGLFFTMPDAMRDVPVSWQEVAP